MGAARTSTSDGRGGRTSWGRAILAALGAFAVVSGIFGTTQVASAAPTVTYPGAISNISLTNDSGSGPLTQWQKVRITGDWAVPAGAFAGETFGMTLPEEFSRLSTGSFTIADPDTGAVMANCVVDNGQGAAVVCTLTDAVNGLDQVGGSFWMQAEASQTTTNETVEFDLGTSIEVVDLPGEGGIIVGTDGEPAEPAKWGDATVEDGIIRWVIAIPSGYVADGSFTIKDSLADSETEHHYTGRAVLKQRAVENGTMVGDWVTLDPTAYEIAFAPDGRSFDFSASGLPRSGYTYELIYFTEADGATSAGDVFGNAAIVNTTKTSAEHVATDSGGGDGHGTTYTQFSITKALTGPLADEVRDAAYTVRYSVKGSDAPAVTMTVPVGESVTSGRAPIGSTFVIEEIDLPAVTGVTWGAWTITGEGVTAAADGRYEVTPGSSAGVALTLTNTANTVPSTPPPTTPPTPTPSEPPTPKPTRTGSLAQTGGGDGLAALPAAIGLILAGAITAIVASRRRHLAK
ncbi:hypothetical protein SRABI76_02757 [Microbacterium oxydans]|uniref:Ig-like domain-containing protein n=1 Tax=Microbacterium oxydans TaxID=82380 RepID=UPI001DEED4EC|nr:Ig-like domain-containing protein [Microbacterium oxydans]CAH0231211.1 hypothetical protein SRABI76_02757 [Microbacterium oxydans]